MLGESGLELLQVEVGHQEVPMFEGGGFCLPAGRDQFVHAIGIGPHVDDLQIHLFALEIGQGIHTPRTSRLDVKYGPFHFFALAQLPYSKRESMISDIGMSSKFA